MSKLRTFAIVAAAAACFAATAASAQTSDLTNGPNGMRPNTLGSRSHSSGINAKMPSRAITNPNSGFYRDTGANLIHRHRNPAHYRHHYLRR